jgi:hypothetical protein
VNVETKGQSKQWINTFAKQAEEVQTNDDGTCFLGQERDADGGIHATRDHNIVRNVLQNTKKLCRAIQNKGVEY